MENPKFPNEYQAKKQRCILNDRAFYLKSSFEVVFMQLVCKNALFPGRLVPLFLPFPQRASKVEFGVLQRNCFQVSAKKMQMRIQGPLLLSSAYTCSKDLNYKALTLQILTQLLLNFVNFNRFFELSTKIRQVCKNVESRPGLHHLVKQKRIYRQRYVT